MDISTITKAISPTRDFECELAPGFVVTVAFISKKDMQAIGAASEVVKYDAGTKTRRTTSDSEAYNRKLSEYAVKGWRGLTVERLSKLLPVDPNGIAPETDVEYTPKNAEHLLANSVDFDGWLAGICFNAANFSMLDTEQIEKNSSGSSKSKNTKFEEPVPAPGR